MNIKSFNVNVCSENPERLQRFYEEIVGLSRIPNIPSGFLAGTTGFLVDGHGDVGPTACEPQRVLLTFTVGDAAEEQRRLEALGVEFVRPATKEPWGGLAATFKDLDGNYCQLVSHPGSV